MDHILDLIDKLSTEELIQLGQKIQVIYKQKIRFENLEKVKAFRFGDIVSFETKGGLQTGIILKISPTVCKINTVDGSYRVSPKYLMPCEDPPQDVLKMKKELFLFPKSNK